MSDKLLLATALTTLYGYVPFVSQDVCNNKILLETIKGVFFLFLKSSTCKHRLLDFHAFFKTCHLEKTLISPLLSYDTMVVRGCVSRFYWRQTKQMLRYNFLGRTPLVVPQKDLKETHHLLCNQKVCLPVQYLSMQSCAQPTSRNFWHISMNYWK